MLFLQHVLKVKISETFYILLCFGTTSLKSVTIAPLNSDAKFSLKILDLHLDFIKFMVEKVDLHTQVVPNILQVFQ